MKNPNNSQSNKISMKENIKITFHKLFSVELETSTWKLVCFITISYASKCCIEAANLSKKYLARIAKSDKWINHKYLQSNS